jgi:hypothetical protein
VHHEAHLLPAWLPSAVQVLPVCAASSCSTLLVCHRRREPRRTRSVLCLPMQTQRALLAKWVIRAHISHGATTRGTQDTPDRLIRHGVITRDVTQRFPLLDTLEHGCPCRGRDLPARISYGMRLARQRHEQRIVKGKGERIILGRGSGSVFQVDK